MFVLQGAYEKKSLADVERRRLRDRLHAVAEHQNTVVAAPAEKIGFRPGYGQHRRSFGGQIKFLRDGALLFVLIDGLALQFAPEQLPPGEHGLRVVNDVELPRLPRQGFQHLVEKRHVGRAADHHVLIKSGPLGQQLREPRTSPVQQHLDVSRQGSIDLAPIVVRKMQGEKSDVERHPGQQADDMAATGITAAEAGMGNRIVNQQHVGMTVTRAGVQCPGRVGCRLSLEELRVFLAEQRAIFLLQGHCRIHAAGAGEFVMAHSRPRLVHGAQTLPPEPQAEIRLLIIGGREGLVETAKFAELRGSKHEKRSGTIVDFPAEPECAVPGIFTAAVTGAGAVAPDDVAGFLEFPVEQFDAPADGAGARVLPQNVDGGAGRAGLDEGVIVEQEEILADGKFGTLIDGFYETEIFRVSDQSGVFQPCKQIAGAVAGSVVDNDQFERNIGVFQQRSQAKQTEMGLVVEDQQDGQNRVVGRGKAQFFAARQKFVHGRESLSIKRRLEVVRLIPSF